MALALNIFQTIAETISTSATEIYEAPVGYTGVVLLAQVTNIGTVSRDITLYHRRSVGGSNVDTQMLKNYPISASDTANLLTGKLVLESGDKIVILGSDSADLQVVISILETLN
jgi:hypothetical protein